MSIQNSAVILDSYGVPDNPSLRPDTMSAETIHSLATHPAQKTKAVLLRVQGMHCASCTGKVENAAKSIAGVAAARVNLATGDAQVEYDPDVTNIVRIVTAISQSGFEASLPVAESTASYGTELDEEVDLWKHRVHTCLVLMACLVLVAAWVPITRGLIAFFGLISAGVSIRAAHWLAVMTDFVRPAQLLIGSLLYLFVGMPFVWRALKQLRYRSVTMDTLIGLGVTVAFGHGVTQVFNGTPPSMVFFDVGMIAGFVSFGRFLELRSRRSASRAVRQLLSLTPPTATVMENNAPVVRPLSAIGIGDVVLIRDGDRIPLDATVASGKSTTDESWLTGESRKLTKTVGDQLYAGSLNVGGALTAAVTATSDETYLSRIIDLVRTAQCSKASIQRFADRAAFWFVPAVLVIATVTLLVWGLWVGDWHQAIRCAVAVVIVSCPCALGLATPTAIMAACQRGAQEGILIKDAQALETAGRLSCILLDKTGTVTHGQATVVRVDTIASTTDASLDWLRMAAAAEQRVHHPLAEAIVEYVSNVANQPVEAIPPSVANCETLLGEGIKATVDGRQMLVGNERLMQRFRVPLDDASQSASPVGTQPPSHRHSVVFVAIDGTLVGQLTIQSATDPHGRKAVRELKAMGLITMIVSGDRAEATTDVGDEIGVDDVISQAKPDDKHALVKKMQAAGHRVAMVGDGINDAPALAAADLGIAMGNAADVALDTAGVVLTRGDMRQVVTVVKLARATLSTIRWNLAWAVAYNICLIPLASGLLIPLTRFVPWGWLLFGQLTLPPSLAAAAMAASSLSVVTNSLRLATRSDI